MATTQAPYIIFEDVETGGLPPRDGVAFDQCALTELASVVIDVVKLEIVEEKNWLIKPYKPGLTYSPGATKVTGLTVEILERDGMDVKEVHAEHLALLKKYKKGRWLPVLAGHNFTSFDIPFLVNMFKHFNDDLYKYIQGIEDTRRWASYKWIEATNYKLGTVCSNLGVELTDAHRALADTKANAEAFIEMIRLLRSEGQADSEGRFRKNFRVDVEYKEF